MKIQYVGHSCFILTESTGTTIVTDPFTKIGYEPAPMRADGVTVSHAHYDHNNLKAVLGNPVVFEEEGTFELDGVSIDAIKSYHDGENGRLRGENLIFKFHMDGLDICHLGDIGEECTAELLEMLLPVNVLLIPVGGKYTIDAEQAKEYVDRVMPEYVIPMHYKSKQSKMDIARVDAFLDLFDKEDIIELDGDSIELLRDNLSEGGTKVILMEIMKN